MNRLFPGNCGDYSKDAHDMLCSPDLEAVNKVPASIFLSLDSLVVSMSIGMFGIAPGDAYRMCAAFLVCDGLATFAGLTMHGPFAAVWLCAYLAFLFALVSRTPVGAALWAPALCSLDNLFAGMSAKSTEPWLDGLTSGVTSGLLAMLGVAIAATALRAMPRRRLL